MLGAGQRIVIARTPSVFQSVYGTGINLAPGNYTGKLDNAGEEVRLVGPLGEVLQDFTYSDDDPWPGRADGNGSSLEIVNPLGDPTDFNNWRSSYEYRRHAGHGRAWRGQSGRGQRGAHARGCTASRCHRIAQHNRRRHQYRRLVPERHERQLQEIPHPDRHDDRRRTISSDRRNRVQSSSSKWRKRAVWPVRLAGRRCLAAFGRCKRQFAGF